MFLKLVLFLATIPYLAQSVPCSCSCTSQTTVTTIEYSACSIIQNYYETLTGAWNTWMLTESSFLPTIGGFPHCSWWNYCRKDCGSLTVSINRYESTQSIYLQTFGYYKGRGTLHFEYVSSLTSDKEMIFQNQFQCAKFNGEDNSVQDLTLSEQEISDITRDFSIVYTDESGKGILIIVSKEKINNGAYYIIVLISEDFYVTGKYIEYRETIKSILIEKNIDCSSLVEIELHSLSNDSGSSCGCGTQISTSTSSGSSTEVSIDITEEELSVEIKPIEKIQDYACKVSGKWFIWKSNTDDLYDTTSSVWNPSGCQSIWYTIESEDGKSNKLKWIQHAYNIKKKATFVLEHRVTTMTKKLATYKDEFISAYWEYDDGSCETVTIGDYEKQLYTSYYSIVWVSPDFSVIVYATNFKINGIRHAWVSVREDVISSGSYTQYAEKIIEILKSYSIVTISDFEITCGCSQQISSASSTQVSVETSSSTEISVEITEEQLCAEIKPIEKIQDYVCKVSGKWFIWKSNTDDLYDTTSSVWNPSGCQSIWYTIESEDGKSNKLKWIQHAYNIKKKATFVLEHRVTTMTKKLATYKDEFISAYWEYDDGSCETVTIGDYEKQLYTSYYSIVWVSPDFSVIVYATNFKINGIRHAWVSVREDVISSGSYTQYAEKIIEILKSYSIVTISDFEITCGCSQQISSASSTQVSVEISEEKVSTGCGCGCN